MCSDTRSVEKPQKFLKIPPSKIKIMGNMEKVLVYGSSQEVL